MADLREMLIAADAERSLLITYSADLPFFERCILDGLQRGKDGRVLILSDRREYFASMRERAIIRHVGTSYRYEAIQLPGPHAAAHAKIFLLATPAEVHALVGSANLTLGGVARNAELIQQLTNRPGSADGRALNSIAEVLTFLLRANPHWAPTVREDIEYFIDRLRAREDTAPAAAGRPEILHSATEPILSQLVAHVPPKAVSGITAISPFFDGGSQAILELADAYPKASLRILKRPEEDDMNGAVLKRLGARVVVEELRSLDGVERRLHAKAVILHAAKRAWVLAGSANLTAPAMLRSASDKGSGGNLEVMLLHEVPAAAVERLLSGIESVEVDHRKLRFSRKDEEAPYSGQVLRIAYAELDGRHLEILVTEVPDDVDHEHVRLSLEDGRDVHALKCSARKRGTGELIIESSSVPPGVLAGQGPLLVEVRVPGRDETLMGQAWIARTEQLARSAALARQLRAFEEFKAGIPEIGSVYLTLLEAIHALASVAQRGRQGFSRLSAPTHSQREAEESPERLRIEDLIIDEEEIRASRRVVRNPRTVGWLLDELAAMSRRLVDAAGVPEAETERRVELPSSEPSAYEEEEESVERSEPDFEPVARTATRELGKILEIVDRVHGDAVSGLSQSEEHVRALFGLSEAITGTLLVRLAVRTRGEGEEVIHKKVQESWRRATSLVWGASAILDRAPEGWLPSLLMADPLGGAAKALDAEHTAAMAAFLAALLASLNRVRSDDIGSDTSGLVIGYHVVRLAMQRRGINLQALTDEACRRLALNTGGAWTALELVEALRLSAEYRQALSERMRQARDLGAIAAANERGDLVGVNELVAQLESHNRSLAHQVRRLVGRKNPFFAGVFFDGEDAVCGECSGVMPTTDRQHLLARGTSVVPCQECGRLLVGCDPGSVGYQFAAQLTND